MSTPRPDAFKEFLRLRSVWTRGMAALVLAAGLSPGGAAAEETPLKPANHGVVELFTSQGCARCPPADKTIADLARMPGMIVLSFPVTTWDYIGWKDTLASPAFAARQRAYAAMRGDRMVFTPQAVVNGIGVETGFDRAAILGDMARFTMRPRAIDVPIHLGESNGRLHVVIGAATATDVKEPVGVYVLRVARTKTVEIDRGANSGRTVTYTNVVRAMSRVGSWMGATTQFDVLELKGDGEGYVVLLQEGTLERPGAILAAATPAGL